MSRRIVILALALAGAVACAGVLQDATPPGVGEAPPRSPRRSPAQAAERPPEPGAAVTYDLAERCGATCRHILAITSAGEGAPAEGTETVWLEACALECTRYASVGQVECYERVTRPGELEACTVR